MVSKRIVVVKGTFRKEIRVAVTSSWSGLN